MIKTFKEDIQQLINQIETAVNNKEYDNVVSLNENLVDLVQLGAQDLSNFKEFYEIVSWVKDQVDSFIQVIINQGA